ncbi:MAG: ParB/RepB/Spo0J family partition protein [Clostridia bacterium]|nr:ParB/RepB/Spo0J family partition protein [Clostridia bacterium]MDD4048585.1 ParB/RepB/Spo0J family partition protein [Clostridia bacterium]
MIKKGLGKGLSALIPISDGSEGKDEAIIEIKINSITPNSFQPRKVFGEEMLADLANSIKEHGVIQPVVVRKTENERYELVVGERRYRACQRLSLKEIPAVVKEYSDEQMMEIALIENLQRQDLSPVEEAFAYKKLLEVFKLTQEQVAQKVSKSRPYIANMVRLLNLPQYILDKVSKNELTVGHVRPLLSINDEDLQTNIAEKMIEKKVTVREAENMVKKTIENREKGKSIRNMKDYKIAPEFMDIEEKLRGVCGTKVSIKNNGDKGKIEISYYNNDDLNRILSLFFDEDIL